MKLACLSTILGYPWGSPDRLWTDLARHCLNRGDAVFLGLSPLTADHDAVRGLCAAGAELFLRTTNSIYRGTRDDLARRLPWRRHDYLEARLTAFAPDLVVITQGATYDSLAEHHLVSWLESRGVPYLVICHNNPAGPGPAASEAARLRKFFSGAAHTLFVSTHNLRLAEQHLGASLPRTRVVQNPLSALIPAALPAPASGAVPVIGLVGRLDIMHKGLDLLLEAVAGLPPRSVRLIFTGRLEDPAGLSALVARHGLTSVVEIRGPLPAAEVLRAYGELDLFLLPSRYEGCPSAMIEALMCGRPVLATAVGGVSDWITDGIEGYVAPAISTDAIRTTLLRALADRPRWPGMGTAARARFDRQRDPDPVASLLELVDTSLPAALRS